MGHSTIRNVLLNALGAEERETLFPHLERVPLSADETVIVPFEPIEHVHFVESGLLSVVSGWDLGNRMEVGLIGREGMAGVPVALGGADTPFRVIVQMPGESQRLSSGRFRNACRELPQGHSKKALLSRCDGVGSVFGEGFAGLREGPFGVSGDVEDGVA